MSGDGIMDALYDLEAVRRVNPELPLQQQVNELSSIARRIRRLSLRRAHATGLGHLGSEYSVTDILVALYCSVMRLPESAGTRTRDLGADRLILSKGHAAIALYATMIAAGVLDASRLRAWEGGGDDLPGHPDAGLIPEVDATTGSLGHGLSLGVGAAIAARIDGLRSRTFVVLGDGELQEGSNWEALMFAAHLQLGNLIAVIDANRLQQGSRVSATNSLDPLRGKLESFGWQCSAVNGHDFADLLGTLGNLPDLASQAPRAIIAHTTKGFGVSFMMDNPAWHHRIPNDRELARGLAELDG